LSNVSRQQLKLFGTAEYISALDTICGMARNNLYIFDNDFMNCGFDTPARQELLNSFLLSSPKNRLLLLAHDTEPMSKFCPRLMALLRQFSHSMLIYQTPKHLHHLSEPFAIADEAGYVRRFHFNDANGLLDTGDNEGAFRLKSRFMEMWAASQPHLSTSTFVL